MLRNKNNININIKDKILHLEFIGENLFLEKYISGDLIEILDRYNKEYKNQYFIFDMNNVLFFDSATIGIFMSILCKYKKTNVFFYGFSTRAENILKQLSMDKILFDHKTIDNVLECILKQEKINE